MVEKFLVVGSCPVYRRGLSEVIQEGIGDVAIIESSSMGQAIRAISREGGVDLVIFDMVLFGGDSYFLISKIKSLYPGTKVIVFIDSVDNGSIDALLGVGVDWFIYRLSESAEIIDDILLCLKGELGNGKEKGIGDRVAEKEVVAKGVVELPSEKGIINLLTDKQYKIAVLLREGLTNKEIAEKVFLSEGTVKNYVSRIYEILLVSNRANAVSKLCEYLE